MGRTSWRRSVFVGCLARSFARNYSKNSRRLLANLCQRKFALGHIALYQIDSFSVGYRSPSFTSTTFHAVGNVYVVRDQLINMFVSGPSITGRQSLRVREFILSGPGNLFNGRDQITRRTSSLVTVLKEKSSSEGI